jgi:hypothetical protein
MTYKLTYINSYGDRIDFSAAGGFVVSSKSGFTENSIDVSMSQGVHQIGGTMQGQSIQSKSITINGELVHDAEAKRKHMLECVAPGVEGRLIYNDEWFIDVVPASTPSIEAGMACAKFQFRLRAAYPYWQSLSKRETYMAWNRPLFSFPWNISDPNPFMFSERNPSRFANIYNGGNVKVPFSVIFRAVSMGVENPSIINIGTLEFIKINRVMNVGEVITVTNTSERITVTLERGGIVEDIFSWTDINSTFFLLDKGDNVLKYDADTNAENLDVRVIMRDAVVGVW